MTDFKGFAELRVPRDLVKKLQYDLDRVLKSPKDHYAAFDFFVTAEHIPDWIHPDDQEARKKIRSGSSLLRITSHLANGVKHFEAKAAHHQSVVDVKMSRYVEAGYSEEGYFEDPLIVYLTAKEQSDLGKNNIEVTDLARRVYEFWKLNAP